MKGKLLIAAATSCCLVSGFAQAQQYTSELDASLRLGLGLNTEPDAELTFENYSSRLRWNGSADAGDGRTIISYLEFGFDQDDGVSNTREAWIGVEADFGTVTGGKQYSAFYDAVTSAVDIAYWGSCSFEIACGRQSSVIKYVGPDDGDLQLMGSTILVPNDADNDFIDGIELGAKLKSGDLTIGAGASVLIGNAAVVEDGFGNQFVSDLGTGFGIGVSASTPLAEDSSASVSLQFANDKYLETVDDGFVITGTFTKDNKYAVVSLADADNTPFFITLGMERPLIEDRAFTYFEVSAVEADVPGVDLDLQLRAVMVFNMDLLKTGS